jgi:hypothetical protein
MTTPGRRRGSFLPIVGAVLGLLTTGCADAPAPPPAPAPPSRPSFTVPPPVTVTAASPTVVVATEGPRRWTMPNLVGKNLQAAQDAIQELTAFEIPVTTSHDATGAGREQLLDRNWKVCSQNIAAGAEINSTSRIDFGAVRTDERC